MEEPGSYFETQVGTCVDDPCPQLPSFTPPAVSNCELPIVLGSDLPVVPGVFYTWQPESAFESPWSSSTLFNPPNNNGCLDAKLTISTICGKSQSYPFTLNYFDAPPVITTSPVVVNNWQIYFNMNVSNASTYTVQVVDAVGVVIYEETTTRGCNEVGKTINVNLTQCDVPFCKGGVLNIIANNDCFGEIIHTEQLVAPSSIAPSVTVSNLVTSDFDFQFDVAVPSNYQYLLIETWDEGMGQLICSNTISRCESQFTGSSFHFDIRDCIIGCLDQCKNYKIRIRLKNFCNDYVDEQIITWNKTSTTFAMPSEYPNVITANNDNVNDELCFTPTGADYYHIVVVDRWGLLRYEDEGCIDESPICLWRPASNIGNDVYYYTITFSNQCGYSDSQHSFVQVYGLIGMNPNNPSADSSLDVSMENETISIFPNPTDDEVSILAKETILSVEIVDNNGKQIVEETFDRNNVKMSLKKIGKGIYTIKIQTPTQVYIDKIERN